MGICDVAVPEWEALKTAGEDPRRCVRKELGHVSGQRVEDIPIGRIGTRYVSLVTEQTVHKYTEQDMCHAP